jgi:hypothetical protein
MPEFFLQYPEHDACAHFLQCWQHIIPYTIASWHRYKSILRDSLQLQLHLKPPVWKACAYSSAFLSSPAFPVVLILTCFAFHLKAWGNPYTSFSSSSFSHDISSVLQVVERAMYYRSGILSSLMENSLWRDLDFQCWVHCFVLPAVDLLQPGMYYCNMLIIKNVIRCVEIFIGK